MCLRLFMLFSAALGCVGCSWLLGVAFGCSLNVHAVSSRFELFKLLDCFHSCLVLPSLAALIQVVLVLSVVFVSSGLFFTIFSC